jgi:two-component system sensor kinase FixL
VRSKIYGRCVVVGYSPGGAKEISKQAYMKMKKKTKKAASRNKARNGESARLEGLVQQQAEALKIKNGQLRNGIKKQIRSERRIHMDAALIRKKELEIVKQREELLHVTRVGKLAEFVSSLAHEISQPLAAILSYAQAGQRMLAEREPKLREILQYIINDNRRASEVIQRLRSLLKKGKPENKPIDINVLINETVVLIATDATVRNTVIKTDFDAHLPFIRGDRIQLQQVLLNLISNSFDAMEDSPHSREILIRTKRLDTGTIMVEVKDSGYGIPKNNISKLFTHFFTSKPDGLGMGLSISRSIVEAHGGRLDVKNNPDRGATFYFTIPVDEKDA